MALFINGVGQDTFNMNGVSIDNLYVDGVLVWTGIPEVASIPRYELTEALVDPSTVDDSANTLPDYNGKLTESDGTTPYEPTALQYPGNGLLELDNGRIMDTQLVVENADGLGLYGIYDADGSSVYKVWALDMVPGSQIGTLYEGDQDNPISDAGGMTLDFDAGTWKITDGRPSWMPSIETFKPVHISFNNNIPTPSKPVGVTINDCGRDYFASPLLDEDGVEVTGLVCTWTDTQDSSGSTSVDTSNNSGCMADYTLNQATYAQSGDALGVFTITLPAGTWTIKSIASHATDATSAGLYTFNGVQKSQDPANSNTVCLEWTDIVSTGQDFTFQFERDLAQSSIRAWLNGIDIIRTA